MKNLFLLSVVVCLLTASCNTETPKEEVPTQDSLTADTTVVIVDSAKVAPVDSVK